MLNHGKNKLRKVIVEKKVYGKISCSYMGIKYEGIMVISMGFGSVSV